jgi:hypothetical protein
VKQILDRDTQARYDLVHVALAGEVVAVDNYQAMVRSSSPREVSIMLDAPNEKDSHFHRRATPAPTPAPTSRLVDLLGPASVPATAQKAYLKWKP